MSYILDALRRAEAERERGEVPSLHAQQFPTFSSEGDEPGRSRLLVGTVVVLTLALAAALAWNYFAAGPAAPPVIQAVTPAPPVALAPPPALVAAAPVVVPAPMPAGPPATAQAPSAPAPTPVQRRAVAAAPTPAALSAAEGRRASRAASAAAPGATPAAASGAGDNRIYAYAELPEAVRREMPKLAFGGASYSKDAASRMVILNGQVFHEGDKVASGIVLQQIKLKGAVLTFKGYRYELGY